MSETQPTLSFEATNHGALSGQLDYASPGNGPAELRLPAGGITPVQVLTDRMAVVAALSNRDFSLSAVDQAAYPTTGSAYRSDLDLLRRDAPDVTKIRQAIGPPFSAKSVEKWRPGLTDFARELAAGLAARDEPVELISDYFDPLLGEAVTTSLGVSKEDWTFIRDNADVTLGLVTEPGRETEIATAWQELYDYCARQIELKRLNPDDGIFSEMVRALDKTSIPTDEIKHVAATVVVGFPTPLAVMNVVSLELMDRPELIRDCLADPTLWTPTVSELMRYRAHFATALPRIAMKDVQLEDGRVIPEGQVVLPSLRAAAHDPSRTEHPDQVDIHQKAARNIVFGTGAHLCPGAPIARQWMDVSMSELFAGMPTLRLAIDKDELRWFNGSMPSPMAIPVVK